VRAANEGETIEVVIRSAVHVVDEIVVILNNSTDATQEIVARLAKEFPERITFYAYPFPVEKVGSARLTAIPDDHPESFVNVSNYALYRCRYSHALKVDGDDLLDAHWLQGVRDAILSGTFPDDAFLYYWGINLWPGPGRGAYANLNFLFPGGLDHACFRLDARAFYTKNRKYEKLVHPFRERNAGVQYLHLKGLKSDCGHGNYDLRADSYYKRDLDRHFGRPSTCSLSELARRNPRLATVIHNLLPVVSGWTSRETQA
jgi:glycosyltransferase involved in cell wall biosynthesis